MNLEERIKLIRKNFSLNQKEFGDRLGVSRDVISNIELGRVEAKEPIVKLICNEFGIDYMWLTSGVGEMFSDPDIDCMALIDRVMCGENEFAKNVFKMFSKFNDEDWKSLNRMINLYSDAANKPSD
jgi:transcriptional regulator with XRE-family HTH domain